MTGTRSRSADSCFSTSLRLFQSFIPKNRWNARLYAAIGMPASSVGTRPDGTPGGIIPVRRGPNTAKIPDEFNKRIHRSYLNDLFPPGHLCARDYFEEEP
jgi:hypothetical protein